MPGVRQNLMEPAEKRLILRYGRIVRRHGRLSETQKIHALFHRQEDPACRRDLIRHYLPLVYRMALRTGEGDRMARIEAGNRALIDCIDHAPLTPQDDLDYLVSRHVRNAFRRT